MIKQIDGLYSVLTALIKEHVTSSEIEDWDKTPIPELSGYFAAVCELRGFLDDIINNPSEEEIKKFLPPLLKGFHVGLLSDSGCPAVADPGAKMVALAHQNNIRVIPMTGPSSIYLALMASGLNGQQFKFHGYLPSDKSERIKKIISIENESKKNNETQIFIETPYRNQHVYNDLIENLREQTKLCIGLNITSENEFILTKNIRDWKKEIATDLKNKPCVFLLQS